MLLFACCTVKFCCNKNRLCWKIHHLMNFKFLNCNFFAYDDNFFSIYNIFFSSLCAGLNFRPIESKKIILIILLLYAFIEVRFDNISYAIRSLIVSGSSCAYLELQFFSRSGWSSSGLLQEFSGTVRLPSDFRTVPCGPTY